ncbi:enoyl-CoA hydratase/isomerase family protein [Sphingobacterium sp. SRCM116780]|uniref:enoyl-CoA hydratase/isomerase family protein n=1 Tax=Sphingobacterium sp. SRCM116780 TaxID=2907623 RepID=UPI001F319724|nr:enoyl-CoA hydratase/isomerase family protein [Sphingobacterium sp. SRCM116780]UIR57933.1 enoyl-CoA hydratase/isomerase family protein [Sphingobacterium sp. SRCM116780]
MHNDVNYKFIKTKLENHVFYLTLARPEKRNAFTPHMISEIYHAIQCANDDVNVRVVVLAAEGPVFCAGMDLKAFENPDLAEQSDEIPNVKLSLGEVMSQLNKPSIAVVEGNVIAGGFLLILECTYVFAYTDVQFSLPEVQIGLFPFQVLAGLLKHFPYHKALDLCIRGEVSTAQEMQDLGLVYALMDQKPTLLSTLISKLTAAAPLAVKMGFESAKELRNLKSSEQYPYLLQQLDKLRTSHDFKEGMDARVEKRTPDWKGE